MARKIIHNDVIENIKGQSLTIMIVFNNVSNKYEVLGTTANKYTLKTFYTISRDFDTYLGASHLYNGFKAYKGYAINLLKKEVYNKWK